LVSGLVEGILLPREVRELVWNTGETPFERSIWMLVFDMVGGLSISCSICILYLEVYWPIFGLCLVSVPSEPTTYVWFPPLNPGVGTFTCQIEFNPQTSVGRRVFSLQERGGIDLGNNFVGVSSGWLVPDGLTATGA
jgi:hypothetical protein